MRPSITYGSRARLGLILPSVNVAAEPQVQAMLPAGVTLHATRLPFVRGEPAEIEAMLADAPAAALLLRDAGVNVIAFHCTAASTYRTDSDARVTAAITAASGCPATSTGTALVAALAAFGARRVALATPYRPEINAREAAFLEARGVAVVADLALGLGDGHAMFAVTPEQWIEQVCRLDADDADLFFISCAAIRAAEVVETLEQRLGRPVVTSNQLVAWHALRLAGVADGGEGFGRLFRFA